VLREKFRFGKKETRARMRAIRSIAHLVQPTERIGVVTANDDDNRILECPLAGQAEFLLTGDQEHLLPPGSWEFAAQQKAHAFEEAMAQMAADPAIRAACAAISRDFAITEADGVTDD
jgi:predicted nucleic acid-binding protein